MTHFEFNSNYEGKRCMFTFKSGEVLYGVIGTFFPREPNNYYFVPSNKMILVQGHMDKDEYEEMKEYCILKDIGDLLSAKEI